jgi:hypothetical protein
MDYEEIGGDAEWMVVSLYDGELFDISVKGWEDYLLSRSEVTTAKEVCRGLTKENAGNLTMLGNRQRSMEKC